jgi:hypothetical protein
LARLAELGMKLAESAARLALANMAEPPPDPEPVSAEEHGAEHLYFPCPKDLPPTPPRDPGTLFNQFARTVRDCITLQNRLATQQTTEARPIADPRRAILRRALRTLAGTVPDNTPNQDGRSHYVIDAVTDRELKADPDRLTPITEILTLICEQLGLDPDDIDLLPLQPSETPQPGVKPPRPH